MKGVCPSKASPPIHPFWVRIRIPKNWNMNHKTTRISPLITPTEVSFSLLYVLRTELFLIVASTLRGAGELSLKRLRKDIELFERELYTKEGADLLAYLDSERNRIDHFDTRLEAHNLPTFKATFHKMLLRGRLGPDFF
jgi:hypothetical protein